MTLQQVEILLVEDSAADAEMTQRTLRKKGIANHIVWVRDGIEATDYLFCTGAYADRDSGHPLFGDHVEGRLCPIVGAQSPGAFRAVAVLLVLGGQAHGVNFNHTPPAGTVRIRRKGENGNQSVADGVC